MCPEILGLGEVVVDWVATVNHFPEPDEKIDSLSQKLFPGGVTGNYLVAASRLGAKCGFFGAIGDESYGELIKNDFLKEKINIDNMLVRKNSETPVNFIFVVKETGEKVIIQSPYMYTTKPELCDINEDLFNDVKLIHSTGIYPNVTLEVFKIARKLGIKTSLDLEKQIIQKFGMKKLEPIIKLTDILIPNKAGAMEISNKDTPLSAAQYFKDLGVFCTVITLGKDGALVVSDDLSLKIDGFKINPVDTTGAGDTFCATFDYLYLIKNFSLEKSCLYANAAAALKCLKLGARTGMSRMQEIETFISTNKV